MTEISDEWDEFSARAENPYMEENSSNDKPSG
jgi:hypothetical protein